MNGVSHPSGAGPEPATVAVLTLSDVHGFEPDGYVGVVLATGSSATQAYTALHERALDRARESHTRHVRGHDRAVSQTYAILGLRLTSGVTASGQPEWLAYGTLVRGSRSLSHLDPNAEY
jgi:hypothetical protein